MPLNFAEVEAPKAPVEFFIVNKKARPLELEGEVLPELIRKVSKLLGQMTQYALKRARQRGYDASVTWHMNMGPCMLWHGA